MVEQVEPRRIRCPVCKMATGDRVCPECGEDLSLLHECQDLAVASYNVGLNLAQQRGRDSIDHAKECLRLAVALRADFAEPHLVLGKLHAQQKQYSEAIACWSKALSIEPKNKETQDCLNALRDTFGGNEQILLEADWQGKPIRIGNLVECTDGYAGIVWRIILSNKSDEFTHIVVSVNDFFPKNLFVPKELITDVSGDVISIGVPLQKLLSHMSCHRSDEELTNCVAEALLTYEPIRAIQKTVLTVAVTDGIVTLSGNVPSSIIKKQAGEIAMSVNGVLAVNNLLVCDTELESTVAFDLSRSPQIKGERIFVRSQLGVVSLEGRVDSSQVSDAIKEMVLKINGVNGIINLLTTGESIPDRKE